MSTEFDKPSLLQRIVPMFLGFDWVLLLLIALLSGLGLLAMYSAGYDHGTRFIDHGRNMLLAAAILFVVAQVPPQKIMFAAVPLYGLGIALLIAVLVFGITKKGAQRWVNVGVVIQPSELLKIAMPLMLAWWFQKREGQLRAAEFIVAGVLLLIPVGLIMKQPDLGTSLLVMAAGLSAWPSSAETFLPGGAAPQPGHRLRQPALGRTLRRLSEAAAAASAAGADRVAAIEAPAFSGSVGLRFAAPAP